MELREPLGGKLARHGITHREHQGEAIGLEPTSDEGQGCQ